MLLPLSLYCIIYQLKLYPQSLNQLNSQKKIPFSFVLGGCLPAVEKMPWPVPVADSQGGTMLPQDLEPNGDLAKKETGIVETNPKKTKNSAEENWVTPQWIRFHPKRNLKPTSISLDWPLAATGITSLYGPRPDPLEKRLGSVRLALDLVRVRV